MRFKYINIILIIFILDVVSKYLIIKYLRSDLDLGIFQIIQVSNPGIAFGLALPILFSLLISLFIIGFLIYFLINKKYNPLALSLIIGGALGNFLERLLFQSVTDFIQVLNFPTFNLADSFITLGFVYLIWTEYKHNKKSLIV